MPNPYDFKLRYDYGDRGQQAALPPLQPSASAMAPPAPQMAPPQMGQPSMPPPQMQQPSPQIDSGVGGPPIGGNGVGMGGQSVGYTPPADMMTWATQIAGIDPNRKYPRGVLTQAYQEYIQQHNYAEKIKAEYATSGSGGGFTPYQQYRIGRDQTQDQINFYKDQAEWARKLRSDERADEGLDINRSRLGLSEKGEDRQGYGAQHEATREQWNAQRKYLDDQIQQLTRQRDVLVKAATEPTMMLSGNTANRQQVMSQLDAIEQQLSGLSGELSQHMSRYPQYSRGQSAAPAQAAAPQATPPPQAAAGNTIRAIVTGPDGKRYYAEGTREDLDAEYPGWEPTD